MITVSPDQMQDRRGAVWGRAARRTTIGLFALFVFAGLVGAFGVRDSSVSDMRGRYVIDIHFPAVTRPGLPATWSLTVSASDGEPFDGPLRVANRASYIDLFDHHDLSPTPDRTWQTADLLMWTFDPPADATELAVTLDIRVQPNSRWAHRGETVVVVDGTRLAVDYVTTVMP